MSDDIAAASGRFSVRRAKPMDAAVIAMVHDQSRRLAYLGLVPDTVLNSMTLSERESYWKAQLVRTGSTIFVAEDASSQLCGFISLEQEPMHNRGEIDRIYVAPSCWRQGAGKLLFQQAVTHFKDFSYTKLLVWVFESNNPARRFYEHFGLNADGAYRNYPPLPRELRYARSIEPW